MSIESTLLNTFAVFAESANFTTAGKQLHLSQPAVHLQVNKLAEQIGLPLYRRRGRALELTEAGRATARFASQQRADVEQFLAAVRGREAERPIVLGAGAGAFLYLIGPAIRAHLAHLRVATMSRAEVLEGIASRTVDVGVIAGPEGEAAPPHSRRLTKVGSTLVVPRGHALAGRKRVGPDDLRDEALVVPPADRPHRVALGQLLAAQRVTWRVAVEASSWELAIHFASLGLGVAVVNACCHLPRSVVGIPFTGLPMIEYRLLRATGATETPRVRALVDDLLRQADAWKHA